MPRIAVLSVVDLDPEEADDLARVVAEAKTLDAYLHIEVRRVKKEGEGS